MVFGIAAGFRGADGVLCHREALGSLADVQITPASRQRCGLIQLWHAFLRFSQVVTSMQTVRCFGVVRVV